MFRPDDYTILIVDDEQGIREMLVRHLEEEGYQVISAASGVDALSQINAQHPDLVLLDAMMPGFVDGFDVLAATRDLTSLSRTPVMLVTAVADARRVAAAIELGVVDYIVKPFKLRDITARVRRFLYNKAPKFRQPGSPTVQSGERVK
jgi:DNA-binding response OmpR family regulator